jgi:hypothetical protein
LVYGVKLVPIKNPASSPRAVKQITITKALAGVHVTGANLATVCASSIALLTIVEYLFWIIVIFNKKLKFNLIVTQL